jgi:hypothetical protein
VSYGVYNTIYDEIKSFCNWTVAIIKYEYTINYVREVHEYGVIYTVHISLGFIFIVLQKSRKRFAMLGQLPCIFPKKKNGYFIDFQLKVCTVTLHS